MRAAENFYKEKLTKILSEKRSLLDIGGGLRVDTKRGNRYSAATEWMRPLIEKIEYKILDPVPDYNPDYIGDIHRLEFANNSLEAIICISVLEHVENPIQACTELHRVLKPGGYCFVYVPFLYYYHAEKGYYRDYWRFTKDTLEMLFKDFSSIELQQLRGALATWLHISPLGKYKLLARAAEWGDKMLNKERSSQTSGYYVFLKK